MSTEFKVGDRVLVTDPDNRVYNHRGTIKIFCLRQGFIGVSIDGYTEGHNLDGAISGRSGWLFSSGGDGLTLLKNPMITNEILERYGITINEKGFTIEEGQFSLGQTKRTLTQVRVRPGCPEFKVGDVTTDKLDALIVGLIHLKGRIDAGEF